MARSRLEEWYAKGEEWRTGGDTSLLPAACTMWDVNSDGLRRFGAIVVLKTRTLIISRTHTGEFKDSETEAQVQWDLLQFVSQQSAFDLVHNIGEWMPILAEPGRVQTLGEASANLIIARERLWEAVKSSVRGVFGRVK